MNVNLDLLGSVVRNVGSHAFGQAFFSVFKDAFDIRSCSVFAFRDSREPCALVSEGCTPGDTELARALAVEYLEGGYRHDPNVCGRGAAGAPSVYCIRADQIPDAGYRQRFYEQPGIRYELVHLAALDGVLYYLSFYRDAGAGPFYTKDSIALRRLGRFAVPALQRHFDLVGESGSAGQATHAHSRSRRYRNHAAMLEHLRGVFLDTSHALSHREAQVCAAIVLGYSASAISLSLKIALNTVATHRKRAYRKLEVCSQSELFTRYFENVRQTQDAA